MSDIERMEALSSKLTHSILDVRSRAAENLLSKFERDIFPQEMLSIPSCVEGLVGSIRASLDMISSSEAEMSKAQGLNTVGTLIRLVKAMSSRTGPDCVNAFAGFLDDAYALSARDFLDAGLKTLLTETAETVAAVQVPALADEVSKYSHSYDHEGGERPSYEPSAAAMAGARAPSAPGPRMVGPGSIGSSGAGKILCTVLCSGGWKLPRVVLTEADDKILFDTEIRVKLGHAGCGDLLRDCLVDFPAEVLLHRPGLLEAVLNVAGTSLTTEDSAAADFSLALSPTGALRWLTALMHKATKAFEAMLDGGGCAVGPISRAGGVEGGAGDDMRGPAASIAARMAKTMADMRYPRAYDGATEQVTLEELTRYLVKRPTDPPHTPLVPIIL